MARVAALAMAESVATGGAVIEPLGTHWKWIQPWSPDDVFFGLIHDATVNATLPKSPAKR